MMENEHSHREVTSRRQGRIHFQWCPRQDRFLPAIRCILCGHPCGQDLPETDLTFLNELLQKGRIKETYVMQSRKPTAQTKTVTHQETPSLFLCQDGKIEPFDGLAYTRSTLYEKVEVYDVERRFVRPEEKNDIVYVGKRPAKKTVPILVSTSGKAELITWEELESEPERLADTVEVVVARAVKQVFVLKRRPSQ